MVTRQLKSLLSHCNEMHDIHTHYREIARNVLRSVKAAKVFTCNNITELLNVYKGSGSYDLNRYLYTNRKLPPLMASLHELLQLLMSSQHFLSHVLSFRHVPTIYRIVCGKHGEDIDALKRGEYFCTKAYTSWSFDAQRALDFAKNGCTLLYADFPTDVPSFYIDGVKHSGLYQHEVVVTCGVQFKIISNDGPLQFDPSVLRGANTFNVRNMITINVVRVKIKIVKK
jgi:hypothetical protein